MNRREFLASCAIANIGLLTGCAQSIAPRPVVAGVARLRSRPDTPQSIAAPGLQALELGILRDGLLYVPREHVASKPLPLLVLLHGASGTGNLWFGSYSARAEAERMIVLAPDSRSATWDLGRGGYGPDVAFIDRALEATFNKCSVDPARIALGGFSDGASYALGLGTTNGDLFTRIIAFSPGFLALGDRIGNPSIFVSHGTGDRVLPIDNASRRIVPRLRSAAYPVEYLEFTGGHAVPAEISDAGLRWLRQSYPAP